MEASPKGDAIDDDNPRVARSDWKWQRERGFHNGEERRVLVQTLFLYSLFEDEMGTAGITHSAMKRGTAVVSSGTVVGVEGITGGRFGIAGSVRVVLRWCLGSVRVVEGYGNEKFEYQRKS